jgi:hypothetical protein
MQTTHSKSQAVFISLEGASACGGASLPGERLELPAISLFAKMPPNPSTQPGNGLQEMMEWIQK